MKKYLLIFLLLVLLQVLVEAQPGAASGLAASTLSTTSILLNWTDNSSNETGFLIERSLASGLGFTQIATAAANSTSYISTGLANGTQYYYRIRSTNGSTSSAYTSVSTATTGLKRYLIDFGASNVLTTATGWNNITVPTTGSVINLVESTGNSSSLKLEIVKDPSNGYGVSNTVGTSLQVLDYPTSAGKDSHYIYQAGGSYRLTGLDNGKAYSIRIFGSRMSAVDERKGLFTINGLQLTLESANNTSQTIVFTNIVPVSGTITMSLALVAGSTFSYINVVDIIESSVAPQAPNALTAVSPSSTQVNLTWVDASSNETGFQVERSLTSGSGFISVITTAANVTAFSDTDLIAGVQYYYRVRAVNAQGNSAYSSEAVVTTLQPEPTAPSDLIANAFSSTQIILSWTDLSVNETGFQIERSLTSGSGFALMATTTANATSYESIGLIPNTTYFYRLRALNSGGTSAFTNEAIATTLIVPPTTPTSLMAVAASSIQINLTWVDTSGNESGFQIERSLTTGAGFILLATTAPNVISYLSTDLAAGTKYFYRIRAINEAGNSNYTTEASETTLIDPPAAPSTLTAVVESSTTVILTWIDESDNETGFQIERSLTSGTEFTVISTTMHDVNTYSNTGLAAVTQYYYRVKAINPGGGSAYTEEAITTTLNAQPVAPYILSTATTSSHQINLTWTDSSSNETGFEVERSETTGVGFSLVHTTLPNTTVYADSTVNPATKYFYRVRAINSIGSSTYTSEASTTTLPLPPQSPNTLIAVADSFSQINLTWDDSSDNETGFQIETSLTSGAGFQVLATTLANITAYSNLGLISGTQYFYQIKAINAGGGSGYSAEAEATTLLAPPEGPANLAAVTASTTQINLSWSDISNNETGFQLERSLTSNADFTVIAVTAANVITYADNTLTPATKYYYRVKSINDISSSSYTAEVNATTQSLTQPFGMIFNETSFASTTKFPIVGTGITRNMNKLVLTGNPTLFTSYIYMNDPSNPFRYTCLENWKVRIRLKTPSLNATSLGVGIGVQSVNAADPYSTTLRWSWSTGANYIYLYYKSTTSKQIVSKTKYVPTANTYYWVEVTRNKDAFTYTIFDGTNGTTQLYSVTLTFPTFTARNYVKAHNTGQFCIHQLGGTNNEVTNWEVSTTALKNADYIGIGDSNMHGMFATDNSQRWVEKAMTTSGKSFNILAGISDRTSDVLLRLPEVIALNPKAVVLSIGRNDLAYSVPLATTQNNITTIINTLQAAGITVNLAGVIASNKNMTSLQNFYNSKTNLQVNGFAATKSVSATGLNTIFNSGDAIHLNSAGNTAMANLLLTILVPQTLPGALQARVAATSGDTIDTTENPDKLDIADSGLHSYPNPVNGVLTIVVKEAVLQNATIQIFDLVGREIFNRTTETNQENLFDVNALSAGLYLIKVRTGSNYYSKSFVKQN